MNEKVANKEFKMPNWDAELAAISQRFSYSLGCSQTKVREEIELHDELLDEFVSNDSPGKLFAWLEKTKEVNLAS